MKNKIIYFIFCQFFLIVTTNFAQIGYSIKFCSSVWVNDGEIKFDITNPNNYEITWLNEESTEFHRTNLPRGVYLVSIYDKEKKCIENFEIYLISCDDEPYITLNEISHAIPDYLDHNGKPKYLERGSINLNVLGIGPFNYKWSNGMTTQDISGLLPGIYTVTVSDQGTGCTNTFSVNIIECSDPAATFDVELLSMSPAGDGKFSGEIAIGVKTVGNSNFDPSSIYFVWNSDDYPKELFRGSHHIENLTPGKYCVTPIGTNCAKPLQSQYCFVVGESCESLGEGYLNASVKNNCKGFPIPAGQIILHPPTTDYPFRVQWSDGQTGLSRQNLSNGVYAVTLTNNKGCISIGNFEINDSQSSSCTFTGVESTQLCNRVCECNGLTKEDRVLSNTSTIEEGWDLWKGKYCYEEYKCGPYSAGRTGKEYFQIYPSSRLFPDLSHEECSIIRACPLDPYGQRKQSGESVTYGHLGTKTYYHNGVCYKLITCTKRFGFGSGPPLYSYSLTCDEYASSIIPNYSDPYHTCVECRYKLNAFNRRDYYLKTYLYPKYKYYYPPCEENKQILYPAGVNDWQTFFEDLDDKGFCYEDGGQAFTAPKPQEALIEKYIAANFDVHFAGKDVFVSGYRSDKAYGDYLLRYMQDNGDSLTVDFPGNSFTRVKRNPQSQMLYMTGNIPLELPIYSAEFDQHFGKNDVFLTSFDSLGDRQFMRVFGSAGEELIRDLSINAFNKNVLLTIVFDSALVSLDTNYLQHDGWSSAVVSIDEHLLVNWAKKIYTSHDYLIKEAKVLQIDEDKIVVAGDFRKDLYFGDQKLYSFSDDSLRTFLLCLNNTGNLSWSHVFICPKGNILPGVVLALQSHGNFWLGMNHTQQGIVVDNGAYTPLRASYDFHFTLIQFDAQGQQVHSLSASSDDFLEIKSAKVRPDKKMTFMGNFSGQIPMINFNNSSINSPISSPAGVDLFFMTIPVDGTISFTQRGVPNVDEYGLSLDINGEDELAYAGFFVGDETQFQGKTFKALAGLPMTPYWYLEPGNYSNNLSKPIKKLEEVKPYFTSDLFSIQKVYPNPAKYELNIDFYASYANDLQVIIRNNLGKIINFQTVSVENTFQTLTIPLSPDLPNGIYTVELRNSLGYFSSSIFVVTR